MQSATQCNNSAIAMNAARLCIVFNSVSGVSGSSELHTIICIPLNTFIPIPIPVPIPIPIPMLRKTTKDLIHFMQRVTYEFLENSVLPSFRYVYMIPGDVMYVPPGSILLEKACVGDNILLRVPSTLMSSDVVDSCIFTCSARKNLGFTMFCF